MSFQFAKTSQPISSVETHPARWMAPLIGTPKHHNPSARWKPISSVDGTADRGCTADRESCNEVTPPLVLA